MRTQPQPCLSMRHRPLLRGLFSSVFFMLGALLPASVYGLPDIVTTITSPTLTPPPYTKVFTGIMTNNGTAMDVTNTFSFVRVGRRDATDSEKTYTSMAISGNYAYVGSTDIGSAFEVFDILDPLNPKWKAGITWSSGLSNYGVKKLVVSGTKAYVVRNNPTSVSNPSGAGTLEIINITTPASAALVPPAHLLQCTTPTALTVLGSYVYVGSTCGSTGYFEIFDTSGNHVGGPLSQAQPEHTYAFAAPAFAFNTLLPSPQSMVASAISAFDRAMCFFGLLCR